MTAPTMLELVLRLATREQMVARLAALCWRPEVECYYHGWMQTGGGHVLHAKRGRHDYDLVRRIQRELACCLDAAGSGGLCWNSPRTDLDVYRDRDETEGRAMLTRRGGWTAIAFWDRSGDRRSASNSVFVVRGDATFEQVVRTARHAWPEVWRRFTFDVVQVDADGRRIGEAR